jgi:hypothetical protein
MTASGYVPVWPVPGLLGIGPSVAEQWGNVGELGWKDFSTEVGIGAGAGRQASVMDSWSIPVPFFQGPRW